MGEETKKWGRREFWGVSYDYDVQWYLTDAQKALQKKLIELCRTTLRPNGIRYDKTYEYPRGNLNALAEMGLLGILVPKELNGLGENHQCAAMVCETIARYGCPSTAMVYVMHVAATATLLLRHHHNDHLKDLLSRLDKDKLVGTLSYSDPATGGHFWFSLSSKCWRLANDMYKILKFSSWTTSAGFADWYAIQTISPGFDGDFSNMSNFLVYKDEIRASTEDWSAIGMHGNQSGPMVSEAVLKAERMIGPVGDGRYSNDESVDTFFLLLTSAVWSGIAMGCIDLARRHVVSRTHGDVGLRVCDYPTIQDYFGESAISTNTVRCTTASLAMAFDKITNNCDWSIHEDITVLKRVDYLHWAWQCKYAAAKNVAEVAETMLHACGGSGFKTDLGLERLLRDGKAGWVMGPSNEVLRGWVGKSVLLGLEAVDFWNSSPDERLLRGELRKMKKSEKRQLAERLIYEANLEEGENVDTFDFDNPLSSQPPVTLGNLENDGVQHEAALKPDTFTALSVESITYLTQDEKYALFKMKYPNDKMHSGCITGQYIEMELPGSKTNRYLSPISDPIAYGSLEIVIRYEASGVMANFLKTLSIGDSIRLRGPCGGLEYHANAYKHVVLLCGGVGVTPAIQIARAVKNNPNDKTKVTIFYQSRTLDELLFYDELDSYTSDERFHVIFTLGDMDDAWSGSDGYIDYKFLSEHMPESQTDGSLKVVICGGSYMITTCLNALNLFKFRSQDIYIYGAFAAEQIRSVYGRNVKLFDA